MTVPKYYYSLSLSLFLSTYLSSYPPIKSLPFALTPNNCETG